MAKVSDIPALDPEVLLALQNRFVADLPRLTRVASFRLRHLSGEGKEEAMAETLALCWKAYRSLTAQGRAIAPLVNKIAQYCARSVCSGRKLAGKLSTTDVMSVACRAKRGFWLKSLSPCEEDGAQRVIEALVDHKTVSPSDEGATQADFVRWLEGLKPRRRRIAEELASGLNTVEVARVHGVSRGRIHQVRKMLWDSWEKQFDSARTGW